MFKVFDSNIDRKNIRLKNSKFIDKKYLLNKNSHIFLNVDLNFCTKLKISFIGKCITGNGDFLVVLKSSKEEVISKIASVSSRSTKEIINFIFNAIFIICQRL